MRRRGVLAALGTGVLGGCSSLTETSDLHVRLIWCCGYSPIETDTVTARENVVTRRTVWNDEELRDCTARRPLTASEFDEIERLVERTEPADWPDDFATPPNPDLGRVYVEVQRTEETYRAQRLAFEEMPRPVEALIERLQDLRNELPGGLGCRSN